VGDASSAQAAASTVSNGAKDPPACANAQVKASVPAAENPVTTVFCTDMIRPWWLRPKRLAMMVP